jgi:two-component system OmpR family response regulator
MTAPAYSSAKNQPTKKTFSVFIVDDDQSYLAALGFRLMKENKYSETKVFCYTSGEECLRNMDLNPSIIILDYYLDAQNPAAMSGLQTLRKIKQINPKVPVVVLSAQGDMRIALDTYGAGAYTYIIKDKGALSSVEKILERLMQLEKVY